MEFQLTDPVLADILSGRRAWPTQQELDSMSDKQKDKDAAAPKVLGSVQHQNPQPPADSTEELDDGRVIQTSRAQPASATVEMYTPAADVTEETEDGRTIQIASKGVPMPMANARALGLVKDGARHGPQETK